jgi:hypothetical protein
MKLVIAIVLFVGVFSLVVGISTGIIYGASYLLTMAFDIPQLTLFQSFVVAVVLGVIKGLVLKIKVEK